MGTLSTIKLIAQVGADPYNFCQIPFYSVDSWNERLRRNRGAQKGRVRLGFNAGCEWHRCKKEGFGLWGVIASDKRAAAVEGVCFGRFCFTDRLCITNSIADIMSNDAANKQKRNQRRQPPMPFSHVVHAPTHS